MATKTSIRFFNDVLVRAVWSDDSNTCFFSVLDIISAIRNESSYQKLVTIGRI